MFDDDPLAQPAKRQVPLDMLSIEELEARVQRLRREIETCEALIAAKRDHKAAADSVFGKAKP